MDEEKRELNFPTEDSDDTKSSAKSPEDAKINMQQSLQRIASGMAQSFAAAHEVVKLVSPAILNFAKMTQEISIAMTPVLEAYGQLIGAFVFLGNDIKHRNDTDDCQ